MVVGTPLYEWLSHNLFVIAIIIGVVAVMGYYLYAINTKKKGRYRQ
jgi:O-antigen/teichoic acid export membrane protein